MPNFEISAVVICDDVRKEASGKDILIGVYGGGILVPSFPVAIPVAVWMEIVPKTSGHFELDFMLKMPGAATPFQMRVVLEVQVGREPAAIYTPSLMCPVTEAGDIEVSVKAVEEADWKIVKTKRVSIGAAEIARPMQFHHGPPSSETEASLFPPTASPPPSEQSAAAVPASKPSRARRRPSTRRIGQTAAPE